MSQHPSLARYAFLVRLVWSTILLVLLLELPFHGAVESAGISAHPRRPRPAPAHPRPPLPCVPSPRSIRRDPAACCLVHVLPRSVFRTSPFPSARPRATSPTRAAFPPPSRHGLCPEQAPAGAQRTRPAGADQDGPRERCLCRLRRAQSRSAPLPAASLPPEASLTDWPETGWASWSVRRPVPSPRAACVP